MKYTFLTLFIATLLLASCIGDDIIFDTVQEEVRILNPIDSLGVGDTYQFEASFINQVGQMEDQTIDWSSSDPSLLSIDATGLATGLERGAVELQASVERSGQDPVVQTMPLIIGDNTSANTNQRSGTIRTTSSYVLEGDFVVKKQSDGSLILEVADNYAASEALPGLYLYLTNNPATNNGALEIGEVKVFKGAHTYQLPGEVELNTYSHLLYYCKPFSVKVGDGEMK